jgi:hypothetical protein
MNVLNYILYSIVKYQYYKKKLILQTKYYLGKKYDLFLIKGSISK